MLKFHGISVLALFLFCGQMSGLSPLWPVAGVPPKSLDNYASFVQPTASGEPDSALFGCFRTNGRQFHEGLDIAPVRKRKRGEATDPIVAIYDGVVTHVNPIAGNSSYGRYVVMEHNTQDLVIFSLYAHLASMEKGLEVGQSIKAGSTIGIMGRSAGNYTIPQQRAHLHLEIGLRLTDSFQTWYDRQAFNTANSHDVYNGMNLVSWNSLDYYQSHLRGRVQSPLHYISQLPPAVMVHVYTDRRPDFVDRYPELVIPGCEPAERAGWEILLSPWGLPLSFKPVTRAELKGVRSHGDISVVGVDRDLLSEYDCRNIISEKSGEVSLGRNGEMIFELLFMPNLGED